MRRMRRKTVLAVVGTRPQFVKFAALYRAYRTLRPAYRLEWLDTGQHYDPGLSDIFMRQLRLPAPRFRFSGRGRSPASQMAAMLTDIERAILTVRPGLVVVFGDTNSTLAGAIAASKLNVPLAHVEAGMRSGNRAMPEESNRIITDRLSSILFCPTSRSERQLRREGFAAGVHRVGDVMADLLLAARAPLARPGTREGYYLATIHRNTNTDDPKRLASIARALAGLDRRVLMPLHPRTKKLLAKTGAARPGGRLRFLPPVSYRRMLELEAGADGVITDSGGVQKEAFLLGVPCVTLRGETEWPETVEAGMNALGAPDSKKILRAMARIRARGARARTLRPFGDGRAGQRILRILGRELERTR